MADNTTGTGGDVTNAPIGTVPAGGSNPPPAEPTPIDLSDDSLVRIKGSDKPVKFSDHVKGFQSQWTKASQEAARLKKELEARDARIREFESRRNTTPQAEPTGDVFADLRKLPYLTGEDAVGVVQSIGNQIRQRDMVLLGTLRQLKSMQDIVNGLHESHSSSSFDAKIDRWLKDGGYDPGYSELAKEVYLAYEGENLDEEFPQIFAKRVEQIESILEAKRQAKIQANRKAPFVPGKGGQTGPSRPLEIKPEASAKEIAEQLWGGWKESET